MLSSSISITGGQDLNLGSTLKCFLWRLYVAFSPSRSFLFLNIVLVNTVEIFLMPISHSVYLCLRLVITSLNLGVVLQKFSNHCWRHLLMSIWITLWWNLFAMIGKAQTLYNFKKCLESSTLDWSCKIINTLECNHTFTVLIHIFIYLYNNIWSCWNLLYHAILNTGFLAVCLTSDIQPLKFNSFCMFVSCMYPGLQYVSVAYAVMLSRYFGTKFKVIAMVR